MLSTILDEPAAADVVARGLALPAAPIQNLESVAGDIGFLLDRVGANASVLELLTDAVHPWSWRVRGIVRAVISGLPIPAFVHLLTPFALRAFPF